LEKQQRKAVLIIFSVLVVLFALVVAQLTVPLVQDYLNGYAIFVSWAAFFILGLVLLLKVRRVEDRSRKKYFLLTGWSAVSFMPSVILHNLLYALTEIAPWTFLVHLANVLHVLFFLLGVIVVPLAFLVGLIGVIRPRSRPASYLLIPYAAWVFFAAYLNYVIWGIN